MQDQRDVRIVDIPGLRGLIKMEIEGTATVTYNGDYEIDIATLPEMVRKAIAKAIFNELQGKKDMCKVNIPIKDLEFETEVTIDVEPDDNRGDRD